MSFLAALVSKTWISRRFLWFIIWQSVGIWKRDVNLMKNLRSSAALFHGVDVEIGRPRLKLCYWVAEK